MCVRMSESPVYTYVCAYIRTCVSVLGGECGFFILILRDNLPEPESALETLVSRAQPSGLQYVHRPVRPLH